MSKNVSDQLVETLVEAGIQRIYAVTGDNLNHVNAAVHLNGKIKWIHVRHEETAAYAAGAEAQLHGLACCAGSIDLRLFFCPSGSRRRQYECDLLRSASH